MLKWITVWLISLLLALSGFSAPPGEAHPSRVVTAARIRVPDARGLRSYPCDGEATLALLGYLRSLEAHGLAHIDPESFRADRWEFLLTLSDGTTVCYEQVHHDYLRRDDGPWLRIDAPQSAALEALLESLSSD